LRPRAPPGSATVPQQEVKAAFAESESSISPNSS
jgi:hypothetical protein